MPRTSSGLCQYRGGQWHTWEVGGPLSLSVALKGLCGDGYENPQDDAGKWFDSKRIHQINSDYRFMGPQGSQPPSSAKEP